MFLVFCKCLNIEDKYKLIFNQGVKLSMAEIFMAKIEKY